MTLGRDEQVRGPEYIATGFAADGRSLIVGENRRKSQNDLTPPTIWLWPDSDPRRAQKLTESFPLVGYRPVPGTSWAVSTDLVKPDLWIWDLKSNKRVKQLGIALPVTSELTPDGRWIITRTRAEFAVWQTGTWRKVASWPMPHEEQGTATLRASPDSRMLATRTADDRFVIRSLPDGKKLMELPAPHRLQVSGAIFSPDSSRLFVLLNTGAVCEWALAALRQELARHRLDWR